VKEITLFRIKRMLRIQRSIRYNSLDEINKVPRERNETQVKYDERFLLLPKQIPLNNVADSLRCKVSVITHAYALESTKEISNSFTPSSTTYER